ncbi:DUF58 domain-containing protein [Psychromicrobium sp. YIM B11713]|uniref:DUF58 domain-containing protein n=1 Tax=Psychromicrobium sp. YIM B11713 TaxID=3145233 RepID=UPI00374EB9AF
MDLGRARFFTARGWGLIGTGLFCILLAQIMGRKDLLTLGLFLLLLPLLAAITVRIIAPRFTVHREFSPVVVEADSTSTVELTVAGPTRFGGKVRMQEKLPGRFGRSPEFSYPGRVRATLDVGLHGSRYQYHLRPASRGQFSIGPVSAELGDVFGMSRHLQSLPGTDLLTVTPRALDLPSNTLSGARGSDGSTATRQQANPSDDDVMTREYRHGDPMRRVHWPATARHGQLMVRQEESVTTPEAVLLLDQRAVAFEHDSSANHHGKDDEHPELRSSARFEWSVVAAMSISAHLIERNYDLRVLDVFGRPGLGSSRSAPEPLVEEYAGSAGLSSIAESLAAIELQEEPGLTAFNERLLDRLSLNRQRGPLIALLGDVSTDQALAVAPAAEGTTAAWAIICSDRAERSEAVATVLREGGWRVVLADEHSALAAVWNAFDSREILDSTADPAAQKDRQPTGLGKSG